MEMKDFKKDFVLRTKKLITDLCDDEFEYNVTLLLNCLMGLICLPVEETDKKDHIFVPNCVQKLKEMYVLGKNNNDDWQIFRSLKNAMSHMHVEVKSCEGCIRHIGLWDKYPKASENHTELLFTIEQLREYALYVADEHLKRL